jgi:hypothetical protein
LLVEGRGHKKKGGKRGFRKHGVMETVGEKQSEMQSESSTLCNLTKQQKTVHRFWQLGRLTITVALFKSSKKRPRQDWACMRFLWQCLRKIKESQQE